MHFKLRDYYSLAIKMVVFFLCFWGLFYLWVVFAKVICESGRGGDFPGALQASGSFFSSFAVVVAIYGIATQNRFAREQVRSESLRYFNIHFWDMVNRLDQSRNEADYSSFRSDGTVSFKGIAVFKEANEQIFKLCRSSFMAGGDSEMVISFNERERYLQIFLMIMKSIDEDAALSPAARESYINSLSFILSEVELLYISIYCSLVPRYRECKLLIEKYSFFKSLSLELLPEKIKTLYKPIAFCPLLSVSTSTPA